MWDMNIFNFHRVLLGLSIYLTILLESLSIISLWEWIHFEETKIHMASLTANSSATLEFAMPIGLEKKIGRAHV